MHMPSERAPSCPPMLTHTYNNNMGIKENGISARQGSAGPPYAYTHELSNHRDAMESSSSMSGRHSAYARHHGLEVLSNGSVGVSGGRRNGFGCAGWDGDPHHNNQGANISNLGVHISNQGAHISNQGAYNSNQGAYNSSQGAYNSNQGACNSNHHRGDNNSGSKDRDRDGQSGKGSGWGLPLLPSRGPSPAQMIDARLTR
jgi:hypothetical protein